MSGCTGTLVMRHSSQARCMVLLQRRREGEVRAAELLWQRALHRPWATWRSTLCLTRYLSWPATSGSLSTAAWARASCTASMPGLGLQARYVRAESYGILEQSL